MGATALSASLSYIANLAQLHGGSYVKTGSSALAEVITHMSDDAVTPNETEQLIIAPLQGD